MTDIQEYRLNANTSLALTYFDPKIGIGQEVQDTGMHLTRKKKTTTKETTFHW